MNDEISGEEWKRKITELKLIITTERCIKHPEFVIEDYSIDNDLSVHFDTCCDEFNSRLNEKFNQVWNS